MKRALAGVLDRVQCRDVRPWAAAVVAAVSVVALTPGCHPDTTECECALQGFTVSISPPTMQSSQLTPSGPACATATVSCTSPLPAGACATYRVVPDAPGTCHVDLFFSGGTDAEQDVNIVQASGCCAGLYADPPSAGAVEFPSPGVAGDGGVDA
jgi:hypothetical protein